MHTLDTAARAPRRTFAALQLSFWERKSGQRRAGGPVIAAPILRADPVRPAAIAIQMVLPFPYPSLTNLTGMIERIIRRAAEQRRPMPTNAELVEAVGNGHTRSGVFRALGRLERAGRVRIEKRPKLRRVFLLVSGLVTDWGAARPGHKPYCTHARGEVPQPAPQRLGAVKVFMPIEWEDVDGCQWPLWAEGQKPNGHYCGASVRRGKSFCADHILLCRAGK